MSASPVAKPAPKPLPSRRVAGFLLRSVWDELVRLGVSPSQLEQLSGVARPVRGDFASDLAEQDVHRLFETAIAVTGDEALGLSVGRAVGTASFHLVGHIVLASPSLSDAIESIRTVEPRLRLRGPRLERLSDGRTRFGLPDEGSPTLGARFEAELTAVLLLEVVRHFLDPRTEPPQVEFAFPAPADVRPYRDVFPGGVGFDGDGTFVVFQTSALRPRSGADPNLLEHFLSLAQRHYGAQSDEQSCASRVRQVVGVHPAPRGLDARAVAQRLGISPRSLARRLAAEGTTISAVMDEVLYARAQELLGRSSATSAQVAEALGYVEPSSFFRAFRRWSGGLTPGEYRDASRG